MTHDYGVRDAASVLMRKGRRVSLRWRPDSGGRRWRWYLDGQAVTLAQLEDEAEQYERLRYRHTERAPDGWRATVRSVVTDPHR